MADDKPTQKAADKPADDDKAEEVTVPQNPVDLGTDADKLPPVPGAGQFMPQDQATEAPAPAPTNKG